MRSMSRDESMVEYMLKMLMQVLLNFSMGLIMALVVSNYHTWPAMLWFVLFITEFSFFSTLCLLCMLQLNAIYNKHETAIHMNQSHNNTQLTPTADIHLWPVVHN